MRKFKSKRERRETEDFADYFSKRFDKEHGFDKLPASINAVKNENGEIEIKLSGLDDNIINLLAAIVVILVSKSEFLMSLGVSKTKYAEYICRQINRRCDEIISFKNPNNKANRV